MKKAPQISEGVKWNVSYYIIPVFSDLSQGSRYSAGTISISQDRPTDASYLFNLSNVTAQGFSYSNAAKTTKTITIALISARFFVFGLLEPLKEFIFEYNIKLFW